MSLRPVLALVALLNDEVAKRGFVAILVFDVYMKLRCDVLCHYGFVPLGSCVLRMLL